VQVEPVGHLASSTNGTAATTSVRLVRVTEEHAGQTMRLEAFDVGDVGSGTVSLQLLPPPDANVGSFAGCEAERDGPAIVVTTTGCGVAGMTSSTYQARTLTISVPIPDDYQCDDAEPEGCWVQMTTTYAAGANPSDTATFTLLPAAPAP
jgi:hypothetical protein